MDLELQLQIKDTIRIIFHAENDTLSNVEKKYLTRNNIEAFNLSINWLIDANEQIGCDHGFYKTKEDDVMTSAYKTIVGKMNLLISSIHDSDLNEKRKNLFNVNINPLGIEFIDDDWEENISNNTIARLGGVNHINTVEIFLCDSIPKPVICKINEVDGNKVSFIFGSEIEKDLFERTIFLMNRNSIRKIS